MIDDKVYAYKYAKEFHFFVKFTKKNFVVAIVSRNKIPVKELIYLFRNICQVQKKNSLIPVTLDDILENKTFLFMLLEYI